MSDFKGKFAERFAEVYETVDAERDTPLGEKTNGVAQMAPLGEWDAGDDIEPPPPRAWLLGNVFARSFVSSLIAEGGTGKTALRYAQFLSLATKRELTGEHVFQRCRALVVSFEDDDARSIRSSRPTGSARTTTS